MALRFLLYKIKMQTKYRPWKHWFNF